MTGTVQINDTSIVLTFPAQQGVPGGQGVDGAAGTGAHSLVVNYGDVSEIALISLTADDCVSYLNVSIGTAFDGVGATLNIGTSDNNNLLVNSDDIILSETGSYTFTSDIIFTDTTQINVYYNAGTAPTQGKLVISTIKG